MNLADAIRQAATEGGRAPFAAMQIQAVSGPDATADEAVRVTDAVELGSTPSGDPSPEQPSAVVAGNGNIVRFELFLDAVQMNALLRALMSSHHSVMTLREAAGYLRVPMATLESMALQHEVPAFQVEGRWRFPKAAIDEWLVVRAMTLQEAETDAA